MASAVYFFFLSGAKKGRIERAELDPTTGVVRIGRQPFCEVALDPYEDLPASGEHARVRLEADGTFTLHDQSSWGTFKNEIRIHGPVPLTTGDVITLGLDDDGRQGPSLKFYMEKDVLRCPGCGGPVYKRHFKCPSCRRKHCLRCIDFGAKTCKPCAQRRVAAAAGAYEVLDEDDDSEPARAPARVVISGKEAQQVRRAQAAQAASARAAARPAARPTSPPPSAPPVDKRTKLAPTARARRDPGVVAEPSDVGSRRGPGARAASGAASPPDPLRAVKARHPLEFSREHAEFGSEPELKIPDLDDLAVPALDDIPAAPAARTRSPSGFGSSTPAAPPSGRASPPRATPPGDPPTGEVIVARIDPRPDRAPPSLPRAEPVQPRGHVLPPSNNIVARRPAAIPCERCGEPLVSSSFFVCEGCRARLCLGHRGASGRCDRCSQAAPVRPGAAAVPPSPGPPPRTPPALAQPPAPPPLPRLPTPPSLPRAPLPPQPPGAAGGPPAIPPTQRFSGPRARPPASLSDPFASSPAGSNPFASPGAPDPFAPPVDPFAPPADPFAPPPRGRGAAPLPDPFASGSGRIPADANPFASGSGRTPADANPFASGSGRTPASANPFAASAPDDPFALPPAPQLEEQSLLDTQHEGTRWGEVRRQDFLETAAESGDDLAAPPPGFAGEDDLERVRFECPYCDRPLAAHAQRCPHCARDL